MHSLVRPIFIKPLLVLILGFSLSATAYAQDNNTFILTDLNLNAFEIDKALSVADNSRAKYQSTTPNIPDSAFDKPMITDNNIHMYLGLASLAFGGITAVSAPDGFDPNLLTSVHYKAAKLSWQLGAAAIGTGLWTHWDDFHLEDGLFDRDNLHIILGTLGVVGYYLAVKSATDEYNASVNGYPSTDHSSAGVLGGGAMITAIALTW